MCLMLQTAPALPMTPYTPTDEREAEHLAVIIAAHAFKSFQYHTWGLMRHRRALTAGVGDLYANRFAPAPWGLNSTARRGSS